MYTTLFLVRNADTEFSRDRRVAGRRDIGLSSDGRAQAAELRDRLKSVDMAEILASPLPRAVETAEIIAAAAGLGLVRDPRLIDFDAGQWEGRPHDEIGASKEYRRFIEDPVTESIPGGERLVAVRERMMASVSQALADNELGANVVVVSHAGPLRVLLAHYLGMNLVHYHRLRLSPASLSVLRFESEVGVPRVLAINCTADPMPALLKKERLTACPSASVVTWSLARWRKMASAVSSRSAAAMSLPSMTVACARTSTSSTRATSRRRRTRPTRGRGCRAVRAWPS
jgi:broad specificity phosphatase PhoE